MYKGFRASRALFIFSGKTYIKGRKKKKNYTRIQRKCWNLATLYSIHCVAQFQNCLYTFLLFMRYVCYGHLLPTTSILHMHAHTKTKRKQEERNGHDLRVRCACNLIMADTLLYQMARRIFRLRKLRGCTTLRRGRHR